MSHSPTSKSIFKKRFEKNKNISKIGKELFLSVLNNNSLKINYNKVNNISKNVDEESEKKFNKHLKELSDESSVGFNLKKQKKPVNKYRMKKYNKYKGKRKR